MEMIQKGILESLRLRAQAEGMGIKPSPDATDAQVLAIIRIHELMDRFGITIGRQYSYSYSNKGWAYVKRGSDAGTIATYRNKS